MDRLAQLSADLSKILDELQAEATQQDARELMAPLAWLDEAYGWLRHEMEAAQTGRRDPVPFTYIPVQLRK
jgi:hypothetical protein